MKYTGTSFDFAMKATNPVTITDAKLTANILELRFEDGNGRGYCAARSRDGVRYDGNFGYAESTPSLNLNCLAEFACYRDETGAVLLHGICTDFENGGERYGWIVRLKRLPKN